MQFQFNFLGRVGAFLAASLIGAPAWAAQPNIIMIVTDDQGFGDVSLVSPAVDLATPNIDALAASGMVF